MFQELGGGGTPGVDAGLDGLEGEDADGIESHCPSQRLWPLL